MHLFSKNIPALAAIIFLWLLTGCRSGEECINHVSVTDGNIVSVTGPETMQQHEQITLTVGVENKDLRCVQEAAASFTNIGLDTLLVTAKLSYLENPTEDCDCRRDPVIYTLLYFTPLDTGTYTITTKPDSSVTNASPGDRIQFNIEVD